MRICIVVSAFMIHKKLHFAVSKTQTSPSFQCPAAEISFCSHINPSHQVSTYSVEKQTNKQQKQQESRRTDLISDTLQQ